MSDNDLHINFKLGSTFIIKSIDEDGDTKRGTCFAISDEYVITANHVITNSTSYHCYIDSDNYKDEKHLSLELIHSDNDKDFAILKVVDFDFKSKICIGCIDSEIKDKVKVCGYPEEKGSIHAPINTSVTNLISTVKHSDLSIELAQVNSINNYDGMSGSPILHNGYAIGILLVQQGGTVLYGILFKDIFDSNPDLVTEFNLTTCLDEEINYNPPICPDDPFTIVIDCNFMEPNIKGLDIGFEFGVWRSDDLVEYLADWLIDYSLTASQKEALNSQSRPRKSYKLAIDQFHIDDINAMADLLLHMAIRKSYKTIPVVNRVITLKNENVFSCSHVVINDGSLEIWLGASSIKASIEDAVESVTRNLDNLFNAKNIKDRLMLITDETDVNWPFYERIKKLSDNKIPIDQRFDRFVVPVFISHESEIISSYDKKTFEESFKKEILDCRDIFIQNYKAKIIPLIDIKIFQFPINDLSDLYHKFVEEVK